MVAVTDMTGKTIGRLTVISRYLGERPDNSTSAFWNCKCLCGNHTIVSGTQLRTERTKSCGCLVIEGAKKRFLKHGHKRGKRNGGYTATYTAYSHMMYRCYNSNDKYFYNYGGRGISVCERWKNNFNNFLTDMGEKPENTELDRIDNNGNYEPGNCRWTTKTQNLRNTRANAYIEYNGRNLCVAEWSDITGLSQSTINRRKALGWSNEEILDTKKYDNGDVSPREKASFNNRINSQFVEYNGRRLTVTQLARETGKDRRKPSWRIKNGWNVDKALSDGND